MVQHNMGGVGFCILVLSIYGAVRVAGWNLDFRDFWEQ